MAVKVNITKDFGGFCLDVNLQSENHRIGILGASGCGKTMTLKAIAGVQDLDQGYIEINKRVLMDSDHNICLKPQKRKVGYVFQNYALFPTQSVEKNIMAGLSGTKAEQRQIANQMIEKFQLQGLAKRLPGQLSGGQQQRVALARIMAYEPEIILLDEPFAALDEFLRERLLQEMMETLEEYQGIVILVSHNRDEIYRFSEELQIMDQGRILCSGNTKEVFRCPGKEKAARLTGCKNIVSVHRLDDYHFHIQDWDTVISVKEKLPMQLDSIGYRAHEFVPIWGEEKENCIPLRIHHIAEFPFEKKYFIKSKKDDICWFVQKEQEGFMEKRGTPSFLQLSPEKILYLTKK